VETFGGRPTPAVGFGFGDAVIVELLKDKGIIPDFSKVSGRRSEATASALSNISLSLASLATPLLIASLLDLRDLSTTA